MVGAIGRVNPTWLESAEFPAEIWLHSPTRKMSLEDTKSSKLCKINVDTPCLQNPCEFSGAKSPHVCSYSTRFQVMANPLSTLGKPSNGGFPAVFQLRLITGGFSHIFSACLGLNPCFTRDSPCWQKNDRNLWAVLTSWSPNSLGTPSREEPVSFQRGRSCVTPRGWRFFWWMGIIVDPNSA